jgi:hypothetical protein
MDMVEQQSKHFRYFKIAEITVRVESDLDLNTTRFKPEILAFMVKSPGYDLVTLRHYFEWPDLKGTNLGKEVYHNPPWSISRQGDMWYYRNLPLNDHESIRSRLAVFNADHTNGKIYSAPIMTKNVRVGGWGSLSLFPTDQIWLVPVLADRNAVLLHSSAVVLNGQGLLFVGHSEAGKSTIVTMLKNAIVERTHHHSSIQVEILCDDRNIVRKWEYGWRVHGTWSHGTVADVSPNSAPLRAILFLQQDTRNKITALTDRKDIWKYLLATLIKAMVTAEWWQKELDVLEQIVNEVPCYTMRFDKSGAIVDQLINL